MKIGHKRRPRLQPVAAQFLLGIAGLALITFICFWLDFGVARTGFAYVILIGVLSLLGSFSASVALSIVAAALLNYFFAPPLFEFRIDAADDIVRIAAFLTTSLVVTALTTKRKRVERELAESRARLEEAQRLAHVGWWERDVITGRVTVSDEVCRILGERPVSQWLHLIHPEDRPRAAEAAAAALRPGGPRYDVEYRVLRPNGTLRVVHSQGDVTRDDSGRPLRKFGVLQDITELRQTEQGLRASEARLEEAQRIAHVGWWERDFSTAHVTLSDEACRIFGVQPVDLPEWHGRWLELIHPDDRPRVAEAAAAALVRGGPRYDVEYRVVRPSGDERIVHSQGDVMWDEWGKAVRQFGVLQDITELRQAEEELRASEERFRTLVQFSFDVYWESDAQHRFIRQEFAAGLADAPPAGSEIGKTRWEVPYLEPDAEAWRQHRATLDAHLPFRDFELARPTPDGGKRYVSVSGLPVFDKSGRFIGYRGVGRHITERKRAEEALRRSEAYLAEAQRLSHTGTLAFNATAAVYWSQESYRIWGLDPLQGLPDRETVLQRIHPDDRERVNVETEQALREKRDFTLEFRIVLPDGTVKHIESTGHPLFSAD
jgi:PAS domain S-box-containing protein